MGKDTIVGAVKEISGKVRSVVGVATGDEKEEASGKVDAAKGKLQKNYGKIKDVIKDTLTD